MKKQAKYTEHGNTPKPFTLEKPHVVSPDLFIKIICFVAFVSVQFYNIEFLLKLIIWSGDSRYDFKRPAEFAKVFEKGNGKEMPNSDSDWDHPLTDEDLRAIDSVIASALPPKRHRPDDASAHSPTKLRRRLPSSLFVSQQQQKWGFNSSTVPFSSCSSRYYHGINRSPVSPFQGNCSSTMLSIRFQPLLVWQNRRCLPKIV